jgi:tetratricopeptide (TPR) repeat protein
MNILGNGLHAASCDEDGLSVQEAELSVLQRIGVPEHDLLDVQSNLASTYSRIGRLNEAIQMERDVYSGRLKLDGEEHEATLLAANNYALGLFNLERLEEAKRLLRRSIPVARRVLGEGHRLVLKMRWNYAWTLFYDSGATLDDLRKAVATLEDSVRISRRVFGGEHPLTVDIGDSLQISRAALRAREA